MGTIFTVIGGAIVLLAAWLGSRLEKDESPKEKRQRFYANATLVGGLIVLITSLTSDRVDDAYREETTNLLTGGDSYLFLDFEQRRGRTVFPIRHSGEYSVYDVRIEIQDARVATRVDASLSDLLGGYQTNDFAVYTETSNLLILNNFEPNEADYADFIAHISARNRRLIQILQASRVQNAWAVRYRIFDADKNFELFHEHVDDDFAQSTDPERPWITFELEADGLAIRQFMYEAE